MPARRLRLALAGGLLAPLLVVPVGAQAVSEALPCPGLDRLGPWQTVPVEPFRGVEGVQVRDVVTGYAVDEKNPQRVLATNGNTVKTSTTFGCAWEDGLVLDATPDGPVPLSGTTSTVVSTALLPGGRALAAVREGSGPASRPHVVVSDTGRRGSWRLSDAGLPAQGAPRLLAAAGDGRTAYLVLSPVDDGGSAGGTLPTVPGTAPVVGQPAGTLYATTDGGASWSVRAPVGQLPPDGVTALAVDVADPNLVYAVAGGRLLVSRDGGRTFADAGFRGVRAVETMERGEVAAAQDANPETGLVLHSTDGGASFSPRPSAVGIGSLGYRRGDDVLLGEGGGRLFRIDARTSGRPQPVQTPLRPTPGTARGDRSAGASFTVLAEHAILRWVDPARGNGQQAIPVVPELAAPPPPPGRVEPATQSVSMPVGESRLLDYTLVLPPSPTPLDLVFLVDTSANMEPFMRDLRAGLRRIADGLVADGVDVKVGLATSGPGPADGEPPYPEVDPRIGAEYRKPALYRLLRPVGPVDRQLQQALDGLRAQQVTQDRTHPEVLEGQLFALRELLVGEGLEEQASPDAAPRFAVPPGQQVGFRPQQGIRRLVVHATQEFFNNPYGTPRVNGEPDLEGVAALLAANRVMQAGIGLKKDARSDPLPDLRTMAELTGARAPAGGLDCTDGVVLEAGAPLVCQTAAGFTGVISDLVRSLADKQDAALVPRAPTPVLGSVDPAPLKGLDVTQRNELPLRVRVSCLDVAPGTYEQGYTATLRGFPVAQAVAQVTCTPLAAAAAVPPRPDPPPVQEPAPPAGQPAQAPAPPAPAPPVVQPQAQAQTQAQTQVQQQLQTQPLTAAALQRQEELQLALALSADEAPGGELAMVDRRRSEQLRALALLSVSMGAASAFGLARLRTRREPAVRVRRAR